MDSTVKKQVHAAFSALVLKKNAATHLGLSHVIVSHYRSRGASFAKQLEVLFNAGLLRFKDEWDDTAP